MKSSCVGCEQNMELDDALGYIKSNLDEIQTMKMEVKQLRRQTLSDGSGNNITFLPKYGSCDCAC